MDAAQFWSLAGELPHAVGAAKKKEEKKKEINNIKKNPSQGITQETDWTSAK